MAGAAGDRVPALPRAPAEAAAGRFAEAAAGRFAEVAAGRFAAASAGRFPFPRADGSSSPTGCVMLARYHNKAENVEQKSRDRSSMFGVEVKKAV